jgi:rhamnosyltransferase
MEGEWYGNRNQEIRVALRVGLCIPILNAGEFALQVVAALKCQTVRPDRLLLVDSGSTDNGIPCLSQLDIEVHGIVGVTFDHGGTRQMAVDMLADCEILVFLTQDAIPACPDSLENLLACFADPAIGAAYGRQLPRPGAQAIEAHARLFNYPEKSRLKSAGDIPSSGLKTAFISNSFAAWRRDALQQVGGFPRRTIMGEDTWVAGRMLLAGWKIAYCAEATVYHSHAYSFRQEWQRYFDTGVFHARNPWMREAFGTAEGEGMRFVKSELCHLTRNAPWRIPSALLRLPCRYLGFRAGLLERYLPAGLKRIMSAQKAFWGRDHEPQSGAGSI